MCGNIYGQKCVGFKLHKIKELLQQYLAVGMSYLTVIVPSMMYVRILATHTFQMWL